MLKKYSLGSIIESDTRQQKISDYLKVKEDEENYSNHKYLKIDKMFQNYNIGLTTAIVYKEMSKKLTELQLKKKISLTRTRQKPPKEVTSTKKAMDLE